MDKKQIKHLGYLRTLLAEQLKTSSPEDKLVKRLFDDLSESEKHVYNRVILEGGNLRPIDIENWLAILDKYALIEKKLLERHRKAVARAKKNYIDCSSFDDVRKTANKKQVREYAHRKLKEFKRWQRIAQDDSIRYSDNYILQADRNKFQPVEYLAINQETAQKELNAIKSAINSISDIRLRQLLILNYLERRPIEQVRLRIKSKYKPYEAIKEGQYNNLKNAALLAFAKQYRNGVLETLLD